MYFQVAFALDRVKALAPQAPRVEGQAAVQGRARGRHEGAGRAGEKALVELIMATHAGMTTDEFEQIVADWLATARHPRFKRPYTELVYQPMLELLAYLRANGFKTFIVSGGGIEFMRPCAEAGLRHPAGAGRRHRASRRSSRCATASRCWSRLPEIDFIDDKAGKPVGIQPVHRPPPDRRLRQLRRRPARCSSGRPPAAGAALRPDRPPHRRRARVRLRPQVARRPARQGASTRRRERGWTVVDMKKDWKVIPRRGGLCAAERPGLRRDEARRPLPPERLHLRRSDLVPRHGPGSSAPSSRR